MTTPLDKPLSRLLTFRYQARRVIATLSPATPVNTEKCIPPLPERIDLRLQGTQQKPFHIPVDELYRVAMRRAMSVQHEHPHDEGLLLVEARAVEAIAKTLRKYVADARGAGLRDVARDMTGLLKEVYALQGTTPAEVAKQDAVAREGKEV